MSRTGLESLADRVAFLEEKKVAATGNKPVKVENFPSTVDTVTTQKKGYKPGNSIL